MKDLAFSAVGVIAVALGLGLAFHWAYPRVEPSGELAGLFVFVAVVLRLSVGKIRALLRKTRPAAENEAPK